jgi:hypothetical protein
MGLASSNRPLILLFRSDMGGEPIAARLFSFPHPVNEVSARLVAGGVVIMSAVAITLDQPWLIVVVAYGFVARVLTGPTLSPLGQLVTRVVTPLLGVAPRPVPGPPKRFAQGIGAVLSVTAAVLAFGFHLPVAAYAVLGVSSPRPPPWKRSSRCVWAARSSPV